MTTEQKFNSAVKVIKSLPKNGSYTPSNEMMLKFYSFYKQASEGPCKAVKPAFWEPVKKAKWDAWMNLGEMSREVAMDNYVNELKKIIETMSFTEPVAEFMDVLGPFYETVDTNHNAATYVHDKINNAPKLGHLKDPISHDDNDDNVTNCHANVNSNHLNSISTSEESDEEYSDTVYELVNNNMTNGNDSGYLETDSMQVDGATESLYVNRISVKNTSVSVGKSQDCTRSCTSSPTNIPSSDKLARTVRGTTTTNQRQKDSSADPSPAHVSNLSSRASTRAGDNDLVLSHFQQSNDGEDNDPAQRKTVESSDVNIHLAMTVIKLQEDMRNALLRVQAIEETINNNSHVNATPDLQISRPYTRNWSLKSIAMIAIWPFIAQLLMSFIRQRLSSRRL